MKDFKFNPDVFIMAVRYAISRTTTAPLTIIDNIKENIKYFSSNKLKIILRDINEDLDMCGEYLWNCDKSTWRLFIDYLDDEIKLREGVNK